jgi:hypothetical protein
MFVLSVWKLAKNAECSRAYILSDRRILIGAFLQGYNTNADTVMWISTYRILQTTDNHDY